VSSIGDRCTAADENAPAKPEAVQTRYLPSFTGDILWLTAGNVVYGFCQWVVILAIARLGNSAMVGQFSLAQAIMIPIVVFFGMQLRVIQSTDQRGRYRFGDYLLNRLLAAAAGLLTLGAILIYLRYSAETVMIILLVGIARTSESVSDIYLGLYQQRGVMQAIGISAAVRGLLSALGLTTVLYATGSLVWGAGAFAVGCISVFALKDCKAPAVLGVTRREQRLRWANVGPLTRLAAPLAVAVLLTSLNSNIPRYFVHGKAGNAGLGIFSALASVQAAGFLLVNALVLVITPRLARAYDTGNLQIFRKLVLSILGAVILVCSAGIAAIVFAGDRIVTLLFGHDYAGQNRTLLTLAGAASFMLAGSVLGAAASAARKLMHQAAAMGIATCVTLICCYFLVPAMGSVGAALSALASAALSFCLMVWISWDEIMRVSNRSACLV
jgi:O-antigen/teichoic acid export membrane protein